MSAQIRSLYASMPDRLTRARKSFGRPLTLSEKILVAHAHDFETQQWERGKRVAVPSTIHCDHLIRAESGAAEDLNRAIRESEEVYKFIRSAARKYGMGFWRP